MLSSKSPRVLHARNDLTRGRWSGQLTSTPLICILLFITTISFTASYAVAAPAPVIRLGVCRVPYSDPADRLAGLMTLLDHANHNRLVAGYNVTAEVYYYPHCNTATKTCDFSPAALATGLAPFIGNFSRFHAIVHLNSLIAGPVIDAARAAKIPVVDPNTIRPEDQGARGVYLFEQSTRTEMALMTKYMLMAHGCARLGVVYEERNASAGGLVRGYATTLRDALVYGGERAPMLFEYDGATTIGQIQNIFFTNGRRCLFMLVSDTAFSNIMSAAVADARFVAGKIKVFGWSQLSQAQFRVGAANYAPFRNVFFTRNVPDLTGSLPLIEVYKNATAAWVARNGTTRDGTVFSAIHGDVPSSHAHATPDGLMWFMRSLFSVKVYASLASRVDLSNVTVARAAFIDAAGAAQFDLHGYPLFPPTEKCLPPPFPQSATTCACGIMTRTEFIYTVDTTNGRPAAVKDRPMLAETNLAQISIPIEMCHVAPDSPSLFPFKVLTAMSVGDDHAANDAKTAPSNIFDTFTIDFFSSANRGTNSRQFVAKGAANSIASRPWAYQTPLFPNDQSRSDEAFQEMIVDYEPFVVFALALPVKRSKTLILLSAMNGVSLEDIPLKSRADGWDENHIQVVPPTADNIHAMAFYYRHMLDKHPGKFTSLHCIATTEAEAILMVKSLHTYQIHAPHVVVSDSNDVWTASFMGWASGSARPFIMASSPVRIDLMIGYVASVPHFPNVVLGVCNSEFSAETVFAYSGVTSLPATADIIFASVMSEFWMPNNHYLYLMSNLGVPLGGPATEGLQLQLAMMVTLVQQMSRGVSMDHQRTAAEIWYGDRTATVGDIVFGPFSNATCDAQTIASKAVDRQCQCSKGIRQLRVHSYYNRINLQQSTRTDRITYSQPTCGVQYLPLIIPKAAEQDNTLVIAVAVVGAVLLVSIAVAVIVLVLCRRTRDNRNAPTNSDEPFAIAFTDIQASTTLWARGPAAMSVAVEQHGAIIRRVIDECEGYEVKTIGDSFMVAFKDVEKAALFSVRVQEALYDFGEWDKELDAHYKEIILTGVVPEDCVDDGNSVPKSLVGDAGHLPMIDVPNVPSDDRAYNTVWKGLRVRVGLHYGMGEIRFEETTGGYDYFGTVVNTAARVEGVGHGGQTLVTDEVMKALGHETLARQEVMQLALGPQPLRGLDDKVSLHQLLPKRLAGRRLPPLRLDVENDMDAKSNRSIASNMSKVADADAMSTEQLAFKYVTEYVIKKAQKGGHKKAGATLNTSTFIKRALSYNVLDSVEVIETRDDPLTSIPSSTVQSPAFADHDEVKPRDVVSDEVGEALHHFHFLHCLLSVVNESYRKDVIAALVQRWHIPIKKIKTDGQCTQALMGLSARAMNSMRHQAMPTGGAHASGAWGQTHTPSVRGTHSVGTRDTASVNHNHTKDH